MQYGMGPAQVFPVPMSSKMTKSVFPENSQWKSDRRDAKLHNILGVTEADLKEARNQSISSVATTKIQNNSLSDATTEAERSPPGQHKTSHEPWKGSSVPTQAKSEHGPVTIVTTPLIHIRNYDSSSTLHSHYDVHNSSLLRSRQPSDSSNLNFPPHKTKSTTAHSTTSGPDSFWQFKLFKSATVRSAKDTKKLTRARAATSHTLPPDPATPTDWRSVAEHLTPKRPKSVKSMIHPSKSKESVGFNLPPPVPASTTMHKTVKYNDAYLMDPTCVKVNIWKPKAGAKHWFDGLEGDSSEDENFDEPEFQQNFVLGIESDFQNDQIKAHSSSKQSQIPTKIEFDSTTRDDANPTPCTTSTRVAVLNAKASKSNLSSTQSAKSQSNPLRHHDLSESSVLDLSSDEEEMPTAKKIESASSKRGVRDSVGMDFSVDSSDELSTARTINVRSRMRPIEVVRIRRPTANPLPARDQSHMSIPKRGSSLALANRHDHHERKDEPLDLITAFPPTPVESVAPSLNTSIRSSAAFPPTPVESVAPSFNTSIRSSVALSSTGSMESRRLMSVTRQEESLLAAMRLKKAAMQYNTSQTKRSEAMNSFETRRSPTLGRTPTHFPSVPQLYDRTQQPFRSNLASRRHRPQSLIGDDALYLQASETTFETAASQNASRTSKGALVAEMIDLQSTRWSLSSSIHSDHRSVTPSLHSSAADPRLSRDTIFPGSAVGNERTAASGHRRTLTVNSHVVALDDLDQAPTRDQIPSQEFIDWPYKGWETRLELGLAQ